MEGGLRIRSLRRILSILLVLAFGLPVAAPAFALGQDSAAGLPSCCRRNGKHHCMMNVEQRRMLLELEGKTSRWDAPVKPCPYCPGPVATAVFHSNVLAPPTAAAVYAEIVAYPAAVAQTESMRRIAHDRSRQKRGPPVSLL